MRLLAIVVTLLFCQQAQADILIRNVTAITMAGDLILKDTSVYIAGDRISFIGPQSLEPQHIKTLGTVIDGSGRYLVPGLAEMHGHLPSSGVNSQDTKETLFLYLAGGVTTVRGMLGAPIQFDMREAIKAGQLDGPTLYLAAPSLNGGSVSSPKNGMEQVRAHHAAGYDLLKIHPGLTREEFLAIADEANRLNMPFGGHVPEAVGLEIALEKGQISIDHMDGFMRLSGAIFNPITDEQLSHLVDVYRRYEPSWIVPSQALFAILIAGGNAEDFENRPENKYMPKSTRDSWARRLRSSGNPAYVHVPANRDKALRALADAGAHIVMGSDAPQLYSVPGFSIKREVETLTAAGFTPWEILEISTLKAGNYFKDKDTFGQIKVGARADLLLLNKDPRENALNLFEQDAVIAAGKLYTREEIDARLAEIAASHQ